MNPNRLEQGINRLEAIFLRIILSVATIGSLVSLIYMEIRHSPL